MHLDDLYSAKRPPTSFVESVCIRPKMYTINGTSEEAGAFLDGFHSGMASHNLSEGAQREVSYWREFSRWAMAQLSENQSKYQDSLHWGRLFQTLRDIYSEDGQAFCKLASLCIQYQEEINVRSYD